MSSSTECLACAATESPVPCDHFKNLQITPNESEEELTLSQVPSVDVNLELAAAILEEQVSVTKVIDVEVHTEGAAENVAQGDNAEVKEVDPADETNAGEEQEVSGPIKATAV